MNKIEFHAQRHIEMKLEMRSLEEKILEGKIILEKEMRLAGEEEVLVFYNADKSIKVKLSDRTLTKLDKEAMAEELDVSKDSLKTKFLLKLVEDGKLTRDQYEQHEYEDKYNMVAVRLVNAE